MGGQRIYIYKHAYAAYGVGGGCRAGEAAGVRDQASSMPHLARTAVEGELAVPGRGSTIVVSAYEVQVR